MEQAPPMPSVSDDDEGVIDSNGKRVFSSSTSSSSSTFPTLPAKRTPTTGFDPAALAMLMGRVPPPPQPQLPTPKIVEAIEQQKKAVIKLMVVSALVGVALGVGGVYFGNYLLGGVLGLGGAVAVARSRPHVPDLTEEEIEIAKKDK